MRRSALAGVVLAAFTLPAGASAATIGVTTTADTAANDGLCSLREAVTAANTETATGGCPAGDRGTVDLIELPAGTYGLTGASGEDANASGDLDVTESVTIAGAGAATTTIDAGGNDRAIDVFDTSDHSLTLEGLTIANGQAPDGPVTGAAASGEPGGAIRGHQVTTVIIRDAVLRDNEAGGGSPLPNPGVGGGGGAIYSSGQVLITQSTFFGNQGGPGGYEGPVGRADGGSGGAVLADGRLRIDASTFYGNFAGQDDGGGGAVVTSASDSATITNSTFTRNAAAGARTGDLGPGAAISALGPLRLTGSTISGNETGPAGPAGGGALYVTGTGPVEIEDSIVAGDVEGGAVQDEITGDQPISLSYSLIGTPPEPPVDDGGGNRIGTGTTPLDPGLIGLGDNGGPTLTMAPNELSPAIDAGSSFGLTTDQRGDPRPVDYTGVPSAAGGDGGDIGAVELPSPPDTAAPELSAVAKKVVHSKQGGVPKKVGISLASNEACAAEVGGTLRARGRKVELGSARADVPGDLSRVFLKLELSRKARKVAEKGLGHGAVKIELAASCSDAAGNTADRTLGVKIKRRRS